MRLNDFMEIILDDEARRVDDYFANDQIVSFFTSQVKHTDENFIDKTILVVCNYERLSIVFESIEQFGEQEKYRALFETLIVTVYNTAVSRQWIHVGMRLMKQYEDVILRNDKRVLPTLLQSLLDSPFLMDLKLSMIKLFLPWIQFQYVDIMINNFTQIVRDSTSETGIMMTNINPFLVAVTILEIFSRTKKTFPLANLRIEILEKQLMRSMIVMMQDTYDPYKVRLMLNQTDLENYSTIDHMARLNLHHVI